MSLKLFLTLGLFLLSTPAFARGGQDRGAPRGQSSSHQSARPSSGHAGGAAQNNPGYRAPSRGSGSSGAHRQGGYAPSAHGYASSGRHSYGVPMHSQHSSHCGHRWQAPYWDGHAWIGGVWITAGH